MCYNICGHDKIKNRYVIMNEIIMIPIMNTVHAVGK